MKQGRPCAAELLAVIRAKCMDCCGRSRILVERCTIERCPLHPFRKGNVSSMEAERRTEIDGQMNLFEVLKGEAG